MRWLGPALDPDQQDLAGMLDDLAADRDGLREEDPARTSELVRTLAGLGVWTLGLPVSTGGGGADHLMTTVALERLGRHWPALGWASVQAHAAGMLMADEPSLAEDLLALHTGTGPVAVLEAAADHVDLSFVDGRLRGRVARVDAADEEPSVLVVTSESSALLVRSPQVVTRPVRTTGLDGALTQSVELDVAESDLVVLDGVDVAAARRTLHLGTAAVAAGIAAAAAAAALDYARERHQFGGPLLQIATVRSGLRRQQARVAQVVGAVAAGSEGPDTAHAIAELACDAAIDVCAAALQSHGGYGYLDEYGAGNRLRDAVSLRAAAALRVGGLAAAARLAGTALPAHDLAPESA